MLNYPRKCGRSRLVSSLGVAFAIFIYCFSGFAAAATSQCSEESTIATVKDLEGANNPLLKIYEKMGMRLEVTIDAIRTVSSSANGALCEGRLTLRFINMNTKDSNTANADEGTRFKEVIEEQRSKKVSEITYKVEVTDDGQNYVTVIPSEADILEKQNRQQQIQQQQYDQEQRNRAFQQESIDRQEQYRRDLQEQWRQR